MEQIAHQQNDLGGYRPKDLYVTKKYTSYKEEILQHISLKDYDLRILQKAMEYMTTTRVRSMSAWSGFKEFILFNIPSHMPITMDHIMSIILYCDMSKYSTKFSESFRKLYTHETIHSVKKRNQEFWWQSKLFIEAVEYYGTHGSIESRPDLEGENGPFCMSFIRIKSKYFLVFVVINRLRR